MLVPPLGQLLKLTADWTFGLKSEYRNSDLRLALNVPPQEWDRSTRTYGPPPLVTLPKRTILKLDRIYIRKGVSDYDSLTFRTVSSPDARLGPVKPGGKGKTVRFFAALEDCNNMKFEWVETLP